MEEKKEKKTIMQIKKETEEYLVKEGLSAREILMIIREIENDAILALVLGQIALRGQGEKDKVQTMP